MKSKVLFWIGSIINLLMIPLLFVNMILGITFGLLGFFIAKFSGYTFNDFK